MQDISLSTRGLFFYKVGYTWYHVVSEMVYVEYMNYIDKDYCGESNLPQLISFTWVRCYLSIESW
jgi:hypothetical protein